MSIDLPPAGGRATESGMSFQAGVAAWFAAHVAAQAPIGSRFGLDRTAIPVRMQMETGRFLDDIEVLLSDDSVISVQCKTRPSLGQAQDSGFGSTIAQLVAHVVERRNAQEPLKPDRVAAVLAVATDASGRLDDLEAACRYLDTGATWQEALTGQNRDRRSALEIFAVHATAHWQALTGDDPTHDDLRLLARLFHIVRFSVGTGVDDEESARALGSSILVDEAAGLRALPALTTVARRLMGTGAPANQQGIIEALRREGVEDTRNPVFDRDIAALRSSTSEELLRLHKHTLLPFGDGVPIIRDCEEELESAIAEGSLLVIGEPGAGKTGVLVSLANRLVQAGRPVLFVSVDSYENMAGGGGVDEALRIRHPLVEVLEAWPGTAPGVVIIDALDAARGGPVEGVFSTLIEELMRRLAERWSIVASVRTFDLKNGARFRRLMLDEPPSLAYSDKDLSDVRHFLIKRLSHNELTSLGTAAPELATRLEASPTAVQDLLGNVFNLSLVADLISRGALDELRSVTTQSDLIDRYEDHRLASQESILAASDAVRTMVSRKRLVVPRQLVTHRSVEEVLRAGVLAVSGDQISFAHHVLFDHVAGRYYLELLDPPRLVDQLSTDNAMGFLLGPAFRFAMERSWRKDQTGKPTTWRLVCDIAAAEGVDPILASIAMRSTAERIHGPEDVVGLARIISTSSNHEATGRALSRIARFGRLAIVDDALTAELSEAWATLASAAVGTGSIHYADAARIIVLMLFEKADKGADAFGEASRSFLRFAWEVGNSNESLTSIGIRSVGKTFATDPVESRALLARVLDPDRFKDHAHEEAGWLAEAVANIAPNDPMFALEIYATLFGRPAPQTGQTWLGGQASSILPLLSTKEQDYEHARWQLTRAYPSFLRSAPQEATLAASAFVLGTAALDGRELNATTTADDFIIVEDFKSLEDWRESRRRSTGETSILGAFDQFLQRCSPDEFAACVSAALFHETASSVWTRLFGIAADRSDLSHDLIWRIATDLQVLDVVGLRRDALQFIAAVYSTRTTDERQRFEIDLTTAVGNDDHWRDIAARLLSLLSSRDLLVTEEARALYDRLQADNALVGNRPYVSFSMHSGTVDTDYLLQSSGVRIDEGSDLELRSVARPLEALLQEVREGMSGDKLAEVWAMAKTVLAEVDRLIVADDSERAAWAAIGEAADRIAGSKAYDPSRQDHPALDVLLGLIDALAESPYPEPSGRTGSMMAWGNWDIRVYAASSTMDLSRRFGNDNPEIVDRLRRHIKDPVASVRLQVVQSIDEIFGFDEKRAWELMEIASHDQDIGVLSFFVAGPLLHRFNANPDRCAAMATGIIEASLNGQDEGSARSLQEALGHLAVHAWLAREYRPARGWIEQWSADLSRHHDLLWPVVSALRSPLFARYAPEGWTYPEVQDRAKAVADAVLDRAGGIIGRYREQSNAQESDAVSQETAKAANSLIDHVCSQLYFGSGAYERTEPEELGLRDAAAKAKFLRDYRPMLLKIARFGSARTLHELTELYEFLAEADPEIVFDDVAGLLLDQVAGRQLRSESLASDNIVRLVRIYLADYKSVFANEDRRARLVNVLELFSSAGSPEALNLLFDLPDLLR